ncbi:RNA polymerase I-specific transcription initiation factor RRN3 isoform X1 [Durio zibethinus]|uniref:RNA polymerase I-specific transcription initiation factor RRN3 isoform X1 n=1 Tax=Durio zibethinus TaxID=66656 RepID=A0A6P5YHL2_DURZI|nr:RNA polymerase I-specific transcription initiation factor RRN3 isoform X1 [Durio zibethinus]XP_022740015.1 RNA polymerase I-specific transcription initiation factor RRN3 isoform X1 [Durio zibethinus]
MGLELPKNPDMDQDNVVNFTDSEIVSHVKDALTSLLSGDSNSYNQLVGVMHHSKQLAPDEVALLETTLKALAGAVSCIDITLHDSLLSAIFSMSLWNYGPHVADALVELIVSLAISNGKYLDLCLGMLVSNFTPPPYFLDKLKLPRGLERKGQVLSRVHAAFKKIADYVPLAPLRLLTMVQQGMPTVYHKDRAILIYVENMLTLESGEIGELVGSTMLMAVVDRLIELDLEIGWDAILQDDFSKGIFEMELEDLEDIVDSAEPDIGEFRLSRKSLAGNSIAELLDNLLVLTFEHLESCERAGRLAKVFETLLRSFLLTVMTAYKSKFTQFVVFYACSLDPENCGMRFAIMLADLFVQDSHPQSTRMSSVAYLASYLSRAKFLSASFISSMLKRLVDWCLEYCNTHDVDINPNAHRVFYSGCQAIMYVLCFRMKVFMDVPRLKSQLLMPLEQILKHKLNPLKVCLPSVVEEFLRQAKAASLFTVSKTFIFDGLLESELSRAFGGLERLDTFFPFDPCLLKRCDSFIRPMFVFWSMVKPTYEDAYDDENDDGSSDDDSIQDFANENEDIMNDVGKSFDEQQLDLDEFDCALKKMSITPKNSFGYKFGGRFQEPTRMPSRIRPSTSPESL